MPAWIRRPAEAATAPDVEAAYERGLHDAKKRDVDLESAYRKGARDAKASRKRHPVLMAGLFVLAAVGAFLIGLAAWNGSFSDAGVVADQGLNTAAEKAAPVVEEAVQDAGQAARDAGVKLRENTRDLANKS